MKLSYFEDTDTLYLELKEADVAESRDMDANGNIVAITLEHASARTDVRNLRLSGIAA